MPMMVILEVIMCYEYDRFYFHTWKAGTVAVATFSQYWKRIQTITYWCSKKEPKTYKFLYFIVVDLAYRLIIIS